MRIRTIMISKLGVTIKIDVISFPHSGTGDYQSLRLCTEECDSESDSWSYCPAVVLKTYVFCDIDQGGSVPDADFARHVVVLCHRALRAAFRLGVVRLDDALWSIDLRGREAFMRLRGGLDALERRIVKDLG